MIKDYRKKPVVIQAVQYDGTNDEEIHGFIDGNYDPVSWDEGYPNIETLEGQMTFEPGAYIIRGVQGEFYPCKQDIFEVTYEDAA